MSKIPQTPEYMDDVTVRLIRDGVLKKDREFLMDDPRFTPEAMKLRADSRSLLLRKKWKKKMVEKFGKLNHPLRRAKRGLKTDSD